VFTRVVPPGEAFVVTHMLEGVLDAGTARGARRLGFDRPAAGKTGTTNEYRDAWFIGFTPDLLAGTWVGFDDDTPLDLSGGRAALPIWTSFMLRATAASAPRGFEPPPGVRLVEIDRTTGQPASAVADPSPIEEAFLAGEEPVWSDPLDMEGAVTPVSRSAAEAAEPLDFADPPSGR